MLVPLLFFLSGTAALVLETVFLRQMTWVAGSAVTATSLVLAAFMAGLAVGAALLGRLADRVRRPLALYGALEVGVGVSSAALPELPSDCSQGETSSSAARGGRAEDSLSGWPGSSTGAIAAPASGRASSPCAI